MDNVFELISDNKFKEFKTAFKKLNDADVKNKDCHSALYIALNNKQYKCAEYLTKHLYINDTNGIFKETALHLMCRKKDKEGIRILLDNNANINIPDIHGVTVEMHYEESLQQYNNNKLREALNILCNTIDIFDNIDDKKYAGFKLLFDRLPNKNIKNICENNVLNVAFNKKQYKCAEYIITKFYEEKIDLNYENYDGYTPLYVACAENQTKIVKLLLKYSANPNILSLWGESPLHVVCKNGNLDIVKMLVEYGANINTLYDGKTPMMCAINYKKSGCVDFLSTVGGKVKKNNDIYIGLLLLMYVLMFALMIIAYLHTHQKIYIADNKLNAIKNIHNILKKNMVH
jgi:ankyrin repeat protein